MRSPVTLHCLGKRFHSENIAERLSTRTVVLQCGAVGPRVGILKERHLKRGGFNSKHDVLRKFDVFKRNLAHDFHPIGFEAVASTDKPRAPVAGHVHDAGGAVLRGKFDGEVDHLLALRIEADLLEYPHHLIHAAFVMVNAVGVELGSKLSH